MKFEDVVAAIGTTTDLRRIASAHVIDHNQLRDDELRSALVKSKPQYTHADTVRGALDEALNREGREGYRVLARLILVDVLLQQYDCVLPFSETEAKVLAAEQAVLDRSNELDLEQLACGDKSSPRSRDLDIYNFVLGVAWEQRESVSPDECNLLTNLRRHLKINEFEHRVLEAKLRRFPKPGNELRKTRSHAAQTVRLGAPRWLAQPEVRLLDVGQQIQRCSVPLSLEGLHRAIRSLHEQRRQARSNLSRDRAGLHRGLGS
ncbi:MAG TPA: hypothetical protein VK524_07160 [Polyangiaceae bacterium]|nr:hypothetical protein [Polyangiaceae bacterium]